MKKRIFLNSIVCLILFTASCNRDSQQPKSLSLVTQSELRSPLVSKKVQNKIEKVEFIDLKVADLKEIQEYLVGKKPIEEQRVVDFRVVIYRFYSQVKVEEGKLVCSAISGQEIGISEDVFQLYKNELSRLNADMEKMDPQNRPDPKTLFNSIQEGLKQMLE